MDIEKAILTAIHYETRVHEVYAQAAAGAPTAAARRTLGFLAREERYHLDFLAEQLSTWRERGLVEPARLKTSLPARATIPAAGARLEAHMRAHAPAEELEMLRRALAVEKETSAYYAGLVAGLPEGEPRRLFQRFLEIEEGHQNLVQAELDSLMGLGVWFDCQEFDLEGER